MVPEKNELMSLLGEEKFAVWERVCAVIEEKYEMERIWDKGYRDWIYEYKYRRGGKTLCALYAKENVMGCQIIFGKAEREKLEAARTSFSAETIAAYDAAATYHDGKWVMFEPDDGFVRDLTGLLAVKRRPNRK